MESYTVATYICKRHQIEYGAVEVLEYICVDRFIPMIN